MKSIAQQSNPADVLQPPLISSLGRPGGYPLRFYICTMILAEKGQSLREDDGKLLHKDTRILGPVMRSDQRLSDGQDPGSSKGS
jgi:hypothetical protein